MLLSLSFWSEILFAATTVSRRESRNGLLSRFLFDGASRNLDRIRSEHMQITSSRTSLFRSGNRPGSDVISVCNAAVASSKRDGGRTGESAKQSVKSSFYTGHCSSSILMTCPIYSKYHIKTARDPVFLEAHCWNMVNIILTVGEKC